jgi:hypothetical protein
MKLKKLEDLISRSKKNGQARDRVSIRRSMENEYAIDKIGDKEGPECV